MSEHDLPDLLDRVADRVAPGPPPLDAMLAGARHTRRRRTTTVLAAAAVMAVVVGGSALVFNGVGEGARPTPGTGAPTPASIVPDGYRLVGAGTAAIAVPEEWGTNRTQCGVPKRNTVVVDQISIPACGTTRPQDVQSVEITEGKPRFDFAPDETTEVDGETAQLQTTRCENQSLGGDDTPRLLCSRTTRFPDLGVSFRAESSSQPEALAREQVEEMLAHVRVLDDKVAVPGHEAISTTVSEGAGPLYVERLREAGLAAVVVTERRPRIQFGHILHINPAPGTILDPGDVVTVTYVR
ncbi:PASTA domain-containing protein [Nocardioides jensenii]|uniref:PASTA domain-containing protein n=1 Tax=Nocardioides jensenii TaxID=1843 RepID=UPI00082C2FCB|nr:PASTA domain-containing protein [Nocardioides jensenii]